MPPWYAQIPMRLGAKPKPMAYSGAFTQCAKCKKTLFKKEFVQNLFVCPYCQHHHRVTAQDRIEITFDEGSFEVLDTEVESVDTLAFPDYAEKLSGAIEKLDRNDGTLSGMATLDGLKVATAVADFSFMGGSMGSLAGEKVTRTLERAADNRCPAIIFCASGGARMQEGLLSLMQMAKTTAAVERCRTVGAPYISVFTDPTMAGVLASYASVADVILAEPRSLIGFAGTRVSKQAQVVKLPDDFQTAEWVYKHGFIDKIVARRDMRDVLSRISRLLMGGIR